MKVLLDRLAGVRKQGLCLESGPHLASSLQYILDHVLALAPHCVALLHEELAEAHPVDLVCTEAGSLDLKDEKTFETFRNDHEKVVHAVSEVINNYPVQIV